MKISSGLKILCVFLLILGVSSAYSESEIEYQDIVDETIVLNGDFSAKVVLTPNKLAKPNTEGGIRFYYDESSTYYVFYVRWLEPQRCDFYGAKYINGAFKGFLIAEEYEESHKDCFVSIDEAWDASVDTAMELTVTVRGNIATVTMTGNVSEISGTLHFDLTKSPWLDGKYTESQPMVWKNGELRKAARGGKLSNFKVDKSTYNGERAVLPEEVNKAQISVNGPSVETALGTFATGTMTPARYTNGKTVMPYQIYLPANYDPEKNYPLILYLHGDGFRGADNTQHVESGEFIIGKTMIEKGVECIIIAPQTPVSWILTENDRGANQMRPFRNYAFDTAEPSKYLTCALDLMYETIEKMAVNDSKLYVYGYSRGAFATWYLLAAYPETFAGAIACAGVGSIEKADVIAQTPVYVFHANNDDVVSYLEDKALTDAVKEAGGDVHFVNAKGLGHGVSSAMRRYYNEVVEWLFSLSK